MVKKIVLMSALIAAALGIQVVAAATTYSGEDAMLQEWSSSDKIQWKLKQQFKKAVTMMKKLTVKGDVILGDATDDSIQLNGTVTSDTGAILLSDDVTITGALNLTQPLSASGVTGVVKGLTAGSNVTITDNGGGAYTIAASDTDTTYTAGTGITLAGSTITASLGSSIATTELDDSAVTSTKIAVDTIAAEDLATASVTTNEISDGTIVNADVSTSGAIAYSKLNLSDTLVNADINSSAAISPSKIASGSFTMTGGSIDNTIIGASTPVAGTFSTVVALSSATIGSTGTAILIHTSSTTTFDGAAINSASCDLLTTVTLPNATSGDMVMVTPTPTTNGIEDVSLSWNAFVLSENTLRIRACNPTAGSIDVSTQTWRIDLWKH